jgi:hypothetical protein
LAGGGSSSAPAHCGSGIDTMTSTPAGHARILTTYCANHTLLW